MAIGSRTTTFAIDRLSISLVLVVTLLAPTAGQIGTVAPAADGAVARGALRIWADEVRGRQWVLALDDVRVFDSGSKRLIARIVLPGWMVARSVCEPALVLDRTGSAFIGSNAEPRIWRVDGETLAVSQSTVRFVERPNWDIGFGALAFAGDGSLLALTANAQSLWKLDLANGLGILVETYQPALATCFIAPRPAGRHRGRLP